MSSADGSSTSPEDAPREFGPVTETLGRSLFPISAVLLIAGTLVWGPWITLVLTLLWWRLVCRIG